MGQAGPDASRRGLLASGVSDSSLVQAHEVDEELGDAKPVSPEDMAKTMLRQKKRRRRLLLLLISAICISTVIITVSVVVAKEQNKPSPVSTKISNRSHISPKAKPPLMPKPITHLKQLLTMARSI